MSRTRKKKLVGRLCEMYESDVSGVPAPYISTKPTIDRVLRLQKQQLTCKLAAYSLQFCLQLVHNVTNTEVCHTKRDIQDRHPVVQLPWLQRSRLDRSSCPDPAKSKTCRYLGSRRKGCRWKTTRELRGRDDQLFRGDLSSQYYPS